MLPVKKTIKNLFFYLFKILGVHGAQQGYIFKISTLWGVTKVPVVKGLSVSVMVNNYIPSIKKRCLSGLMHATHFYELYFRIILRR